MKIISSKVLEQSGLRVLPTSCNDHHCNNFSQICYDFQKIFNQEKCFRQIRVIPLALMGHPYNFDKIIFLCSIILH